MAEDRGNVYDDQYINYDVFNQQLILKYHASDGVSRHMIISDAWLEEFGFDEKYFDVTGYPDSKIFQVIGKMPCRIFYHWIKTLDDSLEHEGGISNKGC